MNVGSPLLLVAVRSLATLPQTVARSPIWFFASAGGIVCALAIESRTKLRTKHVTNRIRYKVVPPRGFADQGSQNMC